MSKRPLEFAKQWLKKARNDLFAADTLLEKEESPTDTIAFHSQQAIEKTLKSLLTAKSIKFQRTHDLDKLADIIEPFLPQLKSYRLSLIKLSHFAVDVRYPEAIIEEPSKEEVLQARDEAWAIFKMVENEINKFDLSEQDNG
jgi:HEPN domain-containing protein